MYPAQEIRSRDLEVKRVQEKYSTMGLGLLDLYSIKKIFGEVFMRQ